MEYKQKNQGITSTTELEEMTKELAGLRQEVAIWRVAGEGVPGLHDILAKSAENAKKGVANIAFEAVEILARKGIVRDTNRKKADLQAYLTAMLIQAGAQELAVAAELRYQIKTLVRDIKDSDIQLSDMSRKIVEQFEEK